MPGYFSATGQLWGNPLYCWSAMREWLSLVATAIGAVLSLYDIVRIDHFHRCHWCRLMRKRPSTASGLPAADFSRPFL
ncbi:MAG: 4-alpha-glucanotransferase [Caldilineaceae bacterium]|nr:4-alpha-glucanotransferase [Caldilineaceae bacterium]